MPELASRDHIRRLIPLTIQALACTNTALSAIDYVAYTRGPGVAGALLTGAGMACALEARLGKPVMGTHHLEGYLLSPFSKRRSTLVSIHRALGERRAHAAHASRWRGAIRTAGT